MTMQERMKASRERMSARAAATNLRDFRFWVLVRHQDGSEFLLNYAFKEMDPQDAGFFWVFTEHNGNHLFVIEDIETHRVFSTEPA